MTHELSLEGPKMFLTTLRQHPCSSSSSLTGPWGHTLTSRDYKLNTKLGMSFYDYHLDVNPFRTLDYMLDSSLGRQISGVLHQLKLLLVLKLTSSSTIQKGCLKQCHTRFNHAAHNKTQLSHARMNCAFKDSSCDLPLSKNLKFTILASIKVQTQQRYSNVLTQRKNCIFKHSA